MTEKFRLCQLLVVSDYSFLPKYGKKILGRILGKGVQITKKPPSGGSTTLLIALIILLFSNGTRSGT